MGIRKKKPHGNPYQRWAQSNPFLSLCVSLAVAGTAGYVVRPWVPNWTVAAILAVFAWAWFDSMQWKGWNWRFNSSKGNR